MKPLKFSIYKQLLPLSLFFVVSLFIWFDGPLIRLNGYSPLQDTEKRVDLIGLFFLVWLFKALFFDTRLKKNASPDAVSEDIKNKIDYLRGRFQGAIKFLKSTVIHKNGKNVNLVRLPWYLVIGPTASGKTSLLATSEIKYILAKQFKTEHLKAIPPSDTCNWWVTRDLVLVDVPGPYLFSKAGALLVTLKQDEIFAYTVPSKIQSYLSAAKPIIAALDGEGAKVISEAQAGFTSQAENAEALAINIKKMYHLSVEKRSKLGQSGRDYFLKHYEMDSQSRQLIDILSKRALDA